VTLVSSEDSVLRVSADGKCAWRSLMPENAQRKIEFHEITLRGGCIEKVAAYPEGSWANLTVNEGSFLVVFGGRRQLLSSGDSLQFAASLEHSYVNPGNSNALVYLVVRLPVMGAGALLK
jgi:hypothetical protein